MLFWFVSMLFVKFDFGDCFEGIGNGMGFVVGCRWYWVSYVIWLIMMFYWLKGWSSGIVMLVLLGGGFEVIVIDLEGIEICDWVVW